MALDDTTKQTQDDLGLGLTDDQSSSSAEGKEGEGKEGEGKQTLTPDQQKERVEFGRRTAKRLDGIETTINTLAENFLKEQERNARLEQMLTEKFSNPPLTDEEKERRYQEHIEFTQRDVKKKIDYEDKFRKVILDPNHGIMDRDPVLHKEIWNEMMSNFNRVLTGDPQIDARQNYLEAKASLLAKRLSAVEKNRGTNNRNLAATGLSIGSKTGEGGEETISLSPDAEAYAKARGLDPAFIKKALSEK